jgi:hypothetical protein
MNFDTQIASLSLMQKFQAVYELFSEFSQDAAELHESLGVNDEASRVLFTSLSRIMAFNDQMNILVSLMREDVRAIDELTTGMVTPTWSDQLDRHFYDWLRASKTTVQNVN